MFCSQEAKVSLPGSLPVGQVFPRLAAGSFCAVPSGTHASQQTNRETRFQLIQMHVIFHTVGFPYETLLWFALYTEKLLLLVVCSSCGTEP